MKTVLVIVVIVGGLIAYYGGVTYRKFEISKALVAQAESFEKNGAGMSLLVLGDSTAVGVGADRADASVPALLANAIGVSSVENQAVSGARVRDLYAQIQNAEHERYAYILVMVGGNDIIRFKSAQGAAAELEEVIGTLPAHDHLIVLTAGNVGGAAFFPWFIRPFYTALNKKYHATFQEAVENDGGTYVNLYEPPSTDPFVQDPETYLAGDGLHPSSLGYALWFQKIRTQLDL